MNVNYFSEKETNEASSRTYTIFGEELFKIRGKSS
jgi:hypothetical protein